MESMSRGREVGLQTVRRPTVVLRLVNIATIVGVGAVVVWFGIAANDASGGQMAAASALFAAIASGWSAAFATIRAKLKSGEEAQV